MRKFKVHVTVVEPIYLSSPPDVLNSLAYYKQKSKTYCPWSHGLRPKKLLVSVLAHVRVPSQRPLAPNVASVTSVADDKGDNEMILGAVHRSPGICLTAEENLRKLQLGVV